MHTTPPLPAQALADAGLNRQHLFELTRLPPELLAQGQASGTCGEHPIDDHSRATVMRALFGAEVPTLEAAFEGLADLVEEHFEAGVVRKLMD